MNCFWCNKRIKKGSVIYKIKCRNKKCQENHDGTYCSKECAETDQWGPVYRGSKIIKGVQK